jgi:LPS O-antigen subunit length determinant protein (WzzB/FepE family)
LPYEITFSQSHSDFLAAGLPIDSYTQGHFMHHTNLSNLSVVQTIFAIAALFLVLYLYFLPTITAIKRNSPHKAAVIILNVLFGFTLFGWIIALVLASKQPQPVMIVYNSPPPPPR